MSSTSYAITLLMTMFTMSASANITIAEATVIADKTMLINLAASNETIQKHVTEFHSGTAYERPVKAPAETTQQRPTVQMPSTVPGTAAPRSRVPERKLPKPQLSPLQKKVAASQGILEFGEEEQAALLAPAPGTDSVAFAQQVASETNAKAFAGRDKGGATLGEAFDWGFRESVIGTLVDEYRSGSVDRNFISSMREGKLNAVIDAQPWQTDLNARNYVYAAQNEEDFHRRLKINNERALFIQRMHNANGWNGVGARITNFIGRFAEILLIVLLLVGFLIPVKDNSSKRL
ncbi:MAG: hypothetical protein Q8L72_05150 [Moraxellaceae bacterium]|nr:hypothetical protein [Moraxellaceae bacterium]